MTFPATLVKRVSATELNNLTADELSASLAPASTTAQGAMSAADKVKLDGYAGTWRSGSDVLSDELGIDGDLYLMASNGDVYQKSAGTYTVIGNLTGPSGPEGQPGANGVGINFRGEFAGDTDYAVNDLVTESTSGKPQVYICVEAYHSSAEYPPSAGTGSWRLLVASGMDGESGTTGDPGIPGSIFVVMNRDPLLEDLASKPDHSIWINNESWSVFQSDNESATWTPIGNIKGATGESGPPGSGGGGSSFGGVINANDFSLTSGGTNADLSNLPASGYIVLDDRGSFTLPPATALTPGWYFDYVGYSTGGVIYAVDGATFPQFGSTGVQAPYQGSGRVIYGGSNQWFVLFKDGSWGVPA